MTLPAAVWRMRESLAKLLEALDAGSDRTRFVGGAVRDTLLGLPVSDLDLATRLKPQEVARRLASAGLKAVPTGIAHGTVTAVLPSGPVEVTTLRRDVSTDGRRATVAFSSDWREDAARRDFTINALYAEPTSGRVHDYFGGLDDLNAGLVRFIGEPLARIAEDHLRILRFFRFHARYGRGEPEPNGYEACSVRARDLMALSRERIADELLKLLASPEPASAVALMLDRDILKPVLPEVDRDGLERLRRLGAADALLRLIALLPPDAAIADGVAARLKLSNAQRKRIGAALAGNAGDPTRPKALAAQIGAQAAVDRLKLSGYGDAAAMLDGWTPLSLPVGGEAMLTHGLRGPEVARALKAIKARWIDEDFPDRRRVAAIADEVAAQILAERR